MSLNPGPQSQQHTLFLTLTLTLTNRSPTLTLTNRSPTLTLALTRMNFDSTSTPAPNPLIECV